MVKEVMRHDVVSEKHAYVWFAIIMWAMYSSLFIRVLMSHVDVHLAKIITLVVLVTVYAIVSYLLRHGMLDFHSLYQEEYEPVLHSEQPLVTIPDQSPAQAKRVFSIPDEAKRRQETESLRSIRHE